MNLTVKNKIDKEIIVNLILERLDLDLIENNEGNFRFWICDDLLPLDIAYEIANKFPEESILKQRDSIREYKRIGIDFESYDNLMELITYSFHDRRVVDRIEQITGIDCMIPDHQLYAGGLSSMSSSSFLNPHLDNSHNDDKSLYRVLNLLYYVSKDWKIENGGNLILYPFGLKKNSITVFSKFNRLVLMETNDSSYHGVSKVVSKNPRRCISNYYFREQSTNGKTYSHVTSFYSFSRDSLVKSTMLSMDRIIRQRFSNIFKKLVKYKNWHKR